MQLKEGHVNRNNLFLTSSPALSTKIPEKLRGSVAVYANSYEWLLHGKTCTSMFDSVVLPFMLGLAGCIRS